MYDILILNFDTNYQITEGKVVQCFEKIMKIFVEREKCMLGLKLILVFQ